MVIFISNSSRVILISIIFITWSGYFMQKVLRSFPSGVLVSNISTIPTSLSTKCASIKLSFISLGQYRQFFMKVPAVNTLILDLHNWRVSDFGDQFCPIFGQEKDEFLTTTVKTLFDENSSNQLYICLCVQNAPVVSNHGKLGPCPRPWRGGGTDHRTTAICRFRARCEGLQAWHWSGEGGYGTGPWQRLGGRRVRGQGEPTGRGPAGRPRNYSPVGREGSGTSTVVRGKGEGEGGQTETSNKMIE